MGGRRRHLCSLQRGSSMPWDSVCLCWCDVCRREQRSGRTRDPCSFSCIIYCSWTLHLSATRTTLYVYLKRVACELCVGGGRPRSLGKNEAVEPAYIPYRRIILSSRLLLLLPTSTQSQREYSAVPTAPCVAWAYTVPRKVRKPRQPPLPPLTLGRMQPRPPHGT